MSLPDEAWRALQRMLGPLGPVERELLEANAELRSYVPGQAVAWEGQEPRSLFLLLSGRVRLARRRPGGGQLPIAFIEPVALFGHVAALNGIPYLATAAAWAPSRVLLLSTSLLGGRAGTSARLSLVLRQAAVRGMSEQLRAVDRRLLSLASKEEVTEGVASAVGAWRLPEEER